MFRTQFQHSPVEYTNPGNRIKQLYGPIFDDDGVMRLIEIGKTDLYAEIQSHADSVDIHVILDRFAKTGDPGVLSRVQGAYGDFTQMPRTFAEALNTMVAAEQYFLGLPVDVRAQFGHDFHQFLASMDAPDFAQKMGIAVDPELVKDTVPNPSSPTQASQTSPSTPPSDSPSSAPPAPAG